jgi:hypothetical protein
MPKACSGDYACPKSILRRLHAMRLRSLSSALAVALAVLLAATPVSATPVSAATPVGQWSAVGPAIYTTFSLSPGESVWDTKVGPDGRLYAFGVFANASGDPTADNLAVYDPSTGAWAGIGSNGAGNGALNSVVYDVAWLNGTLYAAGDFTSAGGVAGANYVAAWNGSSWTIRGGSSAFTGDIYTLTERNGYLYAGGNFINAGGEATADFVAFFDGYLWHGLASAGALDGQVNSWVTGLAVDQNGLVYIGGGFTNVGGAGGDHVAFWDPASESWNPIGGSGSVDNAINGGVSEVALSGSNLYITGSFFNAGGNLLADRVARWTGSAWTNLGSNAAGTDGAFSGAVRGLALYGSNVIVSGNFGDITGVPGTQMLAAWNGSKWMALGNPSPDAPPNNVMVAGRTLYLAGRFGQVAGVPLTAGLAAYSLPAAPSAPRTLKAVSGAKKVSLSWLAPLTTNGAPLRDYVVQYRKSGTTTWLTFPDGVKTTRTAVVTGLKSGWTYQFRVVAKNDWGAGAASLVVVKKAN